METLAFPGLPLDVRPEEMIVLDAVAGGETMQAGCDRAQLRMQTFLFRVARRSSLSDALARARDIGKHVLADTMLTVARDEPDVQRARVRTNAIQFILERRFRKDYGAAVDITVTERVDLNAALDQARQRLRPMSDQQSSVTDLVPNESGTYAPRTTDDSSDDVDIFG